MTPNDELREAAEFIKKPFVERLSDDFGEMVDRANRLTAAANLLADAYLASLDVVHDEPIDEAWLRSVGFEYDHRSQSLAIASETYELAHRPGNCNYPWTLDDDEGDTISLVPGPKARGDVRLLCKAFGISLKETAGEDVPR
jgi:hypothetical protein